MCGIAGFSISDQDHRHINCRKLAKALALQIQRRGTDATGVAWTQKGDDDVLGVWYMKDAIAASQFVDSMDQMASFTRSAIIHTRYATKGSPENNDNNHPILVGDTIGIHNGGIRNDDQIIAEVGTGRTGQVDTEAIFRLIDATDKPTEQLHRLEGSAAIAWFNTNQPAIVNVGRIRQSPLFIGATLGGSMVFASTEQMLRTAAMQAGVKLATVKEIPEGLFLKYHHGKVVEVETLKQEVAA